MSEHLDQPIQAKDSILALNLSQATSKTEKAIWQKKTSFFAKQRVGIRQPGISEKVPN